MRLQRAAFVFLALASLFPQISSGMALVAGILISLTFGNPFIAQTRKWTAPLLQFSVVGLGAAIDFGVAARVGLQGASYTIVGILLTFGVGLGLGRLLENGRSTSVLITAGTAICGGSAIAALAPVIRAKDHDVSISLSTVFLLNAAALILFPWIGHSLGLSERQFGLWAALAIHDTSSVVGAGLKYGAQALEIATTVKLARALWIIPMAWVIGMTWKSEAGDPAGKGKAKKPWFILGFVAVAALVTSFPELRPFGNGVAFVARRLLVLTLFLIGAGLSRASLKNLGVRPFLQGVLLWGIVGSATLEAIHLGWIQ